MQELGPVVSIVIGLALIFARQRFARSIIAGQNALWNFRYGEKEIRISALIAMIAGIGLVVWGSLALFEVVPIKP